MSFKSKIITSYHIEETTIICCSSYRDLGILFSDNFSWDLHYQQILAKAYKSLGFIRHTFKSHGCIHSRKLLYIFLVRSKLLFCWKPYLLKHIQTFERLQRRATKYILNDYHMYTDYKSHLIRLNLLPITYILDIADIMFLIKSLKNPTDNFYILNYVSFSNNQTRSSNYKLKHTFISTNQSRNFYCNRIWNALPVIDLSAPVLTIKLKIKIFMWNHFTAHFDPDDTCSFGFLCPCQRCHNAPLPINYNQL